MDNHGNWWPSTVYDLLSNSRRRLVLYSLLDGDNATIDELTREIALTEGRATDEDVMEEIEISLVHNHVPRLVDHGIVEYDGRDDRVELTKRFDDIQAAVERSKEIEVDGVPATQSEVFSDG
ncbi:hypothetical protein EA462_16845 [Natrarchaeobius halalkaliphilus]|uniref:DUF7344 domain-containing protein n=1 Tax=Natrarchaeobius halalkaliphilus TaxID=1679091 RepID=A0A3N6MQN9_9EURY|nr:hypothetical protein [Natrarchaeobius halalkaliphilus]RQG86139.1 hypothetical protein EA462_16845 [Natrarchaeobius halalkaliphilus]